MEFRQEEQDDNDSVSDALLHSKETTRPFNFPSRWFTTIATLPSRRTRLLCPTLVSILALVSVVEFILLGNLLVHQARVVNSCGEPSQFTRNVGFMSLDHKFDHQWHRLAGNYSGIIWSREGEFETGGIAMFHQLHCLTAMRNSMQAGLEGKLTAVDQNDDDHWPHCMDYLRQVIMCHADSTIERPREVFHLADGTERRVIVGFEEPRTCKDHLPLYKLLQENAVYPESVVEPPHPGIA